MSALEVLAAHQRDGDLCTCGWAHEWWVEPVENARLLAEHQVTVLTQAGWVLPFTDRDREFHEALYEAPTLVELLTPPPSALVAEMHRLAGTGRPDLATAVRDAIADTVHVATEAAEATDRVLTVLARRGLVDRRVTTLPEPG